MLPSPKVQAYDVMVAPGAVESDASKSHVRLAQLAVKSAMGGWPAPAPLVSWKRNSVLADQTLVSIPGPETWDAEALTGAPDKAPFCQSTWLSEPSGLAQNSLLPAVNMPRTWEKSMPLTFSLATKRLEPTTSLSGVK